MSHFIVAVFHKPGQSIEDILAPFCEQDERYFQFERIDKPQSQLEAEYKERKEEYKYTSFEQFMEKWYGAVQNIHGEWGYMCNPNAKWDWYQEGGRWDGFFHLKGGGETNEAEVSEIDWSHDPEQMRKARRFWDVYVDGAPLEEGEEEKDFDSFYKREYFIDQYGTKENYAQEVSSPFPWAFVTPIGEWIEKGEMGWFACSDASFDSRKNFSELCRKYIEEHPDLIVTAVDCHI